MIRLGYAFGHYTSPPDGAGIFDLIVAQARAAEEAGFDSLWVADHLMQTPVVGLKTDPMVECYTTLGALAMVTSQVRLGAFVGCAAYRNAALLGKAVTTLDVISNGRAIFGIGAGWFEEEHLAYGYDFGTIPDRFDRLSDVLEIVRSMFVNETTTHHGAHFRAEGALNIPRPIQPGGPPILIGGSGPKRTLRLVAEHADICNVTGTPDHVRGLLTILDQHCADMRRDPSSICRTYINVVIVRDSFEEAEAAMPDAYRHLPLHVRPIMGTRDDVVTRFRELFGTGIDGLIVSCPPEDRNPRYISLLADLAAEARVP